MLFFYNDIVKYNNLASKFLLSCDKNGEFEADIAIPENVIFVFEDQISQNLTDCRKNRNSPSWIIHCNSICENFRWTSFSPFFEPELERVGEFTKFVQTQLVKIHNGGKGTGILAENIIDKRILTELVKEKKK